MRHVAPGRHDLRPRLGAVGGWLMARPSEVPAFAHSVENHDGTWVCTGGDGRLVARHNGRRPDARHSVVTSRCGFRTTDMAEAVRHASSNQYDWRHAEPVDGPPEG